MSEDIQDIDLFAIILNCGDQAHFIATDVEHCVFSYPISIRERLPHIIERCEYSPFDKSIPIIQCTPTIRMSLGKFQKMFSCNHMHRNQASCEELTIECP
jgi:hypothetical protein